ncbi:MAG TPA: FtsX-like permease family protein [Gallionellaceae bacterium]
MNTLRLAMAMLRRDWRAGEWRVLLMALLLAVGSISTVGLFADRVRQALQQESHALLGADLRVSSVHPLPPAYREEAQRLGLRGLETAVFPSMVTYPSGSLLVEVQAVEQGYPLRGKLVLGDEDGTEHQAQGVPERGTLWADARMLRRSGLQPGDVVNLGKLPLRVAARVVRDVDQAVGFASIAPRVMLNHDDLAATGLLQPGSRINYRLLVAGEAAQVEHLRTWLQARVQAGEKLEDVRDARPEIRQALERAEHFLGLAALMAFVLAGVALALAARRFIGRHLDACAVMRCVGATQAQVLRIFLYQFLILGMAAIALGAALGFAAQAVLVSTVAAMRDANLPLPGWLPLAQATASGLALLLGFTFLPLWQLKRVSPLRVIRRELGLPGANAGLMYASGGVVLSALFLWHAGSLKLGLTVLGGLAAGLLLFGLIAWLCLRALAALPVGRRHVFANLARHGRSNAVQIVALSLGGMALLLLTMVRAELMQNWRDRLPPDAPNHFIVNVQPDQRAALRTFFAQHKLAAPELFPMVRGRLIAINQRNVSASDYAEPNARNMIEREFNLSWSDVLPEGNKVVQGQWWDKPGEAELSVEEGIARTLGIRLGDTLTYDVAGSQFSARVTNLRKLRWDSMRVNFFVITTPALLADYPASYISSFYLPPEQARAGDALLKAFPNLLVIDTEAIITQVRHIMDQIAQTLTAIFLFTLLSGVAVLYAALLATQDERIYQAAILRTLGADSRYLRRLHLGEFAVLGALSGLFAAAGAALLGWVLARNVLEIPYAPSPLFWLVALAGGMATVMLAGSLATRRAARMPPLQVLAA